MPEGQSLFSTAKKGHKNAGLSFVYAVLFSAFLVGDFRAMIRLGEALAKMHSYDRLGYPLRFQVKYVAFSEAAGTGGKLVELTDVAINSLVTRPKKAGFKKATTVSSQKNPQHDFHQTLNFQLASGEIRKAHRILITEFNKQRVYV